MKEDNHMDIMFLYHNLCVKVLKKTFPPSVGILRQILPFLYTCGEGGKGRGRGKGERKRDRVGAGKLRAFCFKNINYKQKK